MRYGIAFSLLIACCAVTAADARCWKPGQNVSEYTDRHTSTGYYSYTEPRCASREYPFGTELRITNRHNGRSTICRVDDFGPAVWTKCKVDVNVVAKKHLRMGNRGVIKAKIEKVAPQARILVASLGVDEIGMESPSAVDPTDLPAAMFHVKQVIHKSSLDLLARARAFLGRNPGGWKHPSLWCGEFMARIAPELARRLDNPAWARDWADLPHVKPRVGAIVVLARGHGGHIGVVSGFDRRGNPRVISGNHGHRVAEGVYSKRRVIAYVGA